MSKGMVWYNVGHHGSDEGLTLQQRLQEAVEHWVLPCEAKGWSRPGLMA